MAVSVIRWKFHDLLSGEDYTVKWNPNEMSTPYPDRKFSYAATTAGPTGKTVVYEGRPDPVQWQWSGEILDRAHFAALLKWSRKRNRCTITDHYGRVFTVHFMKFDPQPKRAIGRYWRHHYTMSCILYPEYTIDSPASGIPA